MITNVSVCLLIEENDGSEERGGSVYDEKKLDVAKSVEQDFDVEGLRDEVSFCHESRLMLMKLFCC